MRPFFTLGSALGLGLLLSACGGGTTAGGTPAGVTAPAPVQAPLRGSLVGSAAAVAVTAGGASVTTLTPSVLAGFLESAQKGTTLVAGEPQCAVSVYRVRYNTVGGAGEATDASAAIFVPSGSAASCTNSRPVLLYAHGTSLQKSYDMADIAGNTEARLAAAVFAAQGFIVVAPNYAGYAGSSLGYHAYLDRVAQAADMLDGLRAARASFAAIGAKDSGKLMVAGYSQGGYVALAAQRAMQEAGSEFPLTAAAGLSGPYALARFGDELFGGAPRNGATVIVPMIVNAGQHASAALYRTPADVYEAQYAATIADLVPGTLGSGELVSQGKLPATALFAFDSLPQAAGYTDYFGANNLIRSDYRAAYLADMAAHPCDQDATSPLACAPAQPLRKWLVRNDLRSYQPAAPTLLCAGHDDPVVPYFNTRAAATYFRARGANVTELDIDDTPGLSDPYRTAKAGFVTARTVLRAASGDAAVATNYHAGLVAPFCMAAARDYFQKVLSR
ncbi:S9 family peptidase [uncultured Massilia sp.]|uniref:alpha/beta hydrolase family protein n=1 Tax=uncultured Massilia sp. TaxID=169973 RepID=UPI0025E57BC4|nr:prolyl oligopeptidase family serine peptidase [uncultured Massilia sp.]